jgi:hypothetical protein
MNKVALPLCKSGPLISEDLSISQKPNMPASQYDYLHEERFPKTPPSSLHNRLQIIITDPVNLKVGPNPPAKITLKEQMNSIFICTQGT